jgi:hypothetical protein
VHDRPLGLLIGPEQVVEAVTYDTAKPRVTCFTAGKAA